ncbi:hypothetical protein [Kitasatospora sp. NPDC088548]|uniref:hypothetical protein n=1 Tax=Kitasatospora sp. NPDC088548 TaxID=3364075 RepID=UPI00382CCF00
MLIRPRRGASGLCSRARIVIPAVAAAYGADTATSPAGAAGSVLQSVPKPAATGPKESSPKASPAADVREESAEDAWWELCGEPELDEPPVADPGQEDAFEADFAFATNPAAATPPESGSGISENAQAGGVGEADGPAVADLAVATPLHSLHAPVAEVSGRALDVGGFSGACAVGVEDVRPERASTREEQPGADAPLLTAGPGPVRPLRGEQHVIERKQGGKGSAKLRRGAGRAVADGRFSSLLTPFGEPREQRLVAVLAPAADLWRRIERTSTREFVLAQVAVALDAVAAWSGTAEAPELLAGRLDFRRRRQGAVPITDPVGWLLHRGLPKGSGDCAEPTCDDGVRLDTGQDCTTCDLRISDRRSIRLILTRQAVAALPAGASDDQRRAAVEAALAEHTRTRQEALAAARHRIAAEQARWEAGRPERKARAADADRARQALPCEDCHTPAAASLCADCRIVRAITRTAMECLDLALVRVNHAHPAETAAVREQIVRDLEHAREQSRGNAAEDFTAGDLGVDPGLMTELVAVEVLRDLQEVQALAHCALLPAADREAKAAHAAAMRSRHRYPSLKAAVEAAAEQAHLARHRAARWLFDRQLAAVTRQREEIESAGRPASAEAGEYNVNGEGRALARQAVENRRAEQLATDLHQAAQECVTLALAYWADLTNEVSRRRIEEQAADALEQVRAQARSENGHLDQHR